MTIFTDVYNRILHVTNKRTQVELAEVLEIRQSSISDAKRRNSIPAEWYMKLFDLFGLNPDWLKYGRGPVYLRTKQEYKPIYDESQPTFTTDTPPDRSEVLNQHSVLTSVYSTSCAYDRDGTIKLQPISKLSLSGTFVTPHINVFRIKSPSMEPLITRDALLGVDTSQKAAISGDIYAVHVQHEGIIIRRVFLDSTKNCFILRSEAHNYPDLILTPDAFAMCVFGRVCWVMQNVK